MTVLDNLIANTDKTAYTSVWDMDKVLALLEGSFTAPAPTPGPPTITVDTQTTSFNDTYYFKGIYSTDNGATWNDFGAMIPDLSTPGTPVLQTLDVNAAISSNGTLNVISFNYYDSVHGTGTAKDILWKCLVISKNRQGRVTPEPIPDITLFTSDARNYQKIAMKDEIAFNVSSGVGKTEVITHDLGYIPMVRGFYQQTSPEDRIDGLWAGYKIDIRATETQVSFVLDAALSTVTATGYIEYRIYYKQ